MKVESKFKIFDAVKIINPPPGRLRDGEPNTFVIHSIDALNYFNNSGIEVTEVFYKLRRFEGHPYQPLGPTVPVAEAELERLEGYDQKH